MKRTHTHKQSTTVIDDHGDELRSDVKRIRGEPVHGANFFSGKGMASFSTTMPSILTSFHSLNGREDLFELADRLSKGGLRRCPVVSTGRAWKKLRHQQNEAIVSPRIYSPIVLYVYVHAQ